MTDIFVVRNQLGHYWGKSKAWVDGSVPRSVMRTQHEDDADAPDSDATYPGENPLDDGQFLPAANDSSEEFRLHAQQILETFSRSQSRQISICLHSLHQNSICRFCGFSKGSILDFR